MKPDILSRDDIPRLAYRQGWQDALQAMRRLSRRATLPQVLDRIAGHIDGALLEYCEGSAYLRPELAEGDAPPPPRLSDGEGYVRGATVWHLVEMRGDRTVITRCGEAFEGAVVIPELTNGGRVCKRCRAFAAGRSMKTMEGSV